MIRSGRHRRPAKGSGRAGIPAAVALVVLLSLALATGAAATPKQAIYDDEAMPTWTAQINGSGTSDDSAYSAVATATGVYVAGTAGNAAGNLDATLARFSSSGARLWLKRYDGAAHGDDKIARIVKGPGGTIYGVGSTERANGSTDLLVIKWGADGSRKWVKTYDGAAHGDDFGVALGVDKYGAVTAAGTSSGATHFADYVVVRWSSNGVRKKLDGKSAWRYNGSGNIADQAHDVHVESGGAAYVTGYTGLSGSVQAALTVKFSAAGGRVWLKIWRGAESLGGYATSLTPRPGGGVYIAGSMKMSADNDDAMVLRYSSTGAFRLLPTLPSVSDDFFHDVAVTTGKRIVAVGYYVDAANAAVLIWNSETAEPLSWGFGGDGTDWFTAVTADTAGGFYATGHQSISPSTSSILTIRRSLIDLNSGFHSLWGPASSNLPEAVVAIGTRAYIVGETSCAGEGTNQVVLSYIY